MSEYEITITMRFESDGDPDDPTFVGAAFCLLTEAIIEREPEIGSDSAAREFRAQIVRLG